MKNRTLLLLMAFLYLTQIACKQRQFGYLSKVRVKQENVAFSNMTKIKTNLPPDTSLDHETLINVFAAQEPQSSYGIVLFQGVRPKIGTNTNSYFPIDTAKVRLNTKESKKPKTIEPKNNTEANIAIILTAFHIISIFGYNGLLLLYSADDWLIISAFFLVFGFGLIILYFAVKGLYYYFTHRKNKGLIFSSLAFIYASIIVGIFFYFLLYYLF